jgi:hypothetical protein
MNIAQKNFLLSLLQGPLCKKKKKKMMLSIKVFVTLLDYLKIPRVAILSDFYV